ncbi:MAG: hypothetical protein ABIM99_06425 [Candidatus Dojkabacteria bacterium]
MNKIFLEESIFDANYKIHSSQIGIFLASMNLASRNIISLSKGEISLFDDIIVSNIKGLVKALKIPTIRSEVPSDTLKILAALGKSEFFPNSTLEYLYYLSDLASLELGRRESELLGIPDVNIVEVLEA